MQIVIDIPDGYVGVIMANQRTEGSAMDKLLRQATIDGTPLPKGHGDLIDSNGLKTAMFAYMKDKNKTHEAKYAMSVAKGIVDLQKPIIEAESEVK